MNDSGRKRTDPPRSSSRGRHTWGKWEFDNFHFHFPRESEVPDWLGTWTDGGKAQSRAFDGGDYGHCSHKKKRILTRTQENSDMTARGGGNSIYSIQLICGRWQSSSASPAGLMDLAFIDFIPSSVLILGLTGRAGWECGRRKEGNLEFRRFPSVWGRRLESMMINCEPKHSYFQSQVVKIQFEKIQEEEKSDTFGSWTEWIVHPHQFIWQVHAITLHPTLLISLPHSKGSKGLSTNPWFIHARMLTRWDKNQGPVGSR